MASPHPYYPPHLEIASYLPNDKDTLTLLSTFAAACVGVFAVTYGVAIKCRPQISNRDMWTVLWFVLCANIHLVLEGYYVANFRTLASKDTLLGQLWKEYALSDSRYLAPDAFVLCMESITAIAWGPLSFLMAYLIISDHPLRHPIQALVSLGQLYGDILYYATSGFAYVIFNLEHSRPEPRFFYGYFVFLNTFWVLIPGALLYSSIRASTRAFRALKIAENGKKAL